MDAEVVEGVGKKGGFWPCWAWATSYTQGEWVIRASRDWAYIINSLILNTEPKLFECNFIFINLYWCEMKNIHFWWAHLESLESLGVLGGFISGEIYSGRSNMHIGCPITICAKDTLKFKKAVLVHTTLITLILFISS